MARQVLGRDGRRWRVGRRWTPRLGSESLWARISRRFRAPFRRSSDAVQGLDGTRAEGWADELFLVVGVVAVIGFVVFLGVPLVLAVVDLLVLVVLTAAGVLGRVLFRRPWTVEASTDGQTSAWRVVGWRASGDLVRDVQRRVQDGEPLPPASPSPSVR